MQSVLDWLVTLPLAALYASLGAIAAIENFFPPIPADTVVALGSFLAAQGHGSPLAAFLAVWAGNVTGAMIMYGLGRRYGAARIERRLMGAKGAGAEARLQALYARFGPAALFFSRFIPGVRAIVPPFAGALRVPVPTATIAIAGASAIWYGLISYLGFRVGSDWERLTGLMARSGKVAAVIAAVVLIVAGAVVWVRSRRRKA